MSGSAASERSIARAREYGATDIVEARGDDGVAAVNELTSGLGAHSVVEAVGTQESMLQAIRSTRPSGHLGFVGVGQGVAVPGMELFWSLVHLHGGPAPVSRFLPELVDLIWNRQIDPGKVFDLELPLERPRPATRPWISATRSRCCCVHDRNAEVTHGVGLHQCASFGYVAGGCEPQLG